MEKNGRVGDQTFCECGSGLTISHMKMSKTGQAVYACAQCRGTKTVHEEYLVSR